MVQRYCPDTNFFLQAEVPQQLPWGEMTDADTIELVVVDGVLAELDAHKSKGNTRAARRARAVFEKLDPLFEDADEVVFKEANPRVVARLAPALPAGRDRPEELDLSTPDGRIVEQALATANVLGGATLLSHDRLPRRLAKLVGLERRALPDSWLLKEEPDEQGKENRRLKEEVRRLTHRLPQIEVEVLVGGEAVSRIEGTIQRVRPHTEESLEEAVDAVVRMHPEHSRGTPGSIAILHEHDWQRYLNHRRQWVEKVRNVLQGYPRWLDFQRAVVNAELVLRNAGSAPAEGLVVHVEVEGGLRLVHLEKRAQMLEKYSMGLPDPPARPTATSRVMEAMKRPQLDTISPLGRIPAFPTPPMARDRRGWYWDRGDELLTDSIDGECEDFRHGLGDVGEDLGFFPRDDEKSRLVGRLLVRYSARNLPEPVVKQFPIAIDVEWLDPQEAATALLMEQ